MQKIYAWIEERKIAEIIFYIAYTIEMGIMLIDKSAIVDPAWGMLFRVTFCLCLVKILLTKYNWAELGLVAVLGIVAVISYKSTGRNEMLRFLAFMVACKDVDMKRVFRYTFWVTLGTTLLLMFLAAIGVLGTNYMEADFDGSAGAGGVIRRYCFGLGHPNAFHCMLLMIMLLGVLAYGEYIKWWHCVVAMAVNMFFYAFTKSRTGMLTISIFCVIMLVTYLWKKCRECRVIYILAAVGTAACAVLSYCLIRFYKWGTDFWTRLDNLLTGRILTEYVYSPMEEWGLFASSANANEVDMGFIKLFYWYGWIPGLICIAIVLLTIATCYRRKDIISVIVVATIAIYSITESYIVSDYIGRNYLLLIIGMYWSGMLSVYGGAERYIPEVLSFGRVNCE